MKAPLPENEAGRLAALREYRILDTAPEEAFDDLTLLASQICETPIALISLVDDTRQWFKSRVGLDAAETSRDLAFCAHAILQTGQIMEVEDARADPRFAGNDLVTSPPHVRFYAGAPLLTRGGQAVGTLCVIDRVPRKLSSAQITALKALSRSVVAHLEVRRYSRDMTRELSERTRGEAALLRQNQRLAESERETKRLLELAGKSRGALLSLLEDQQTASRDLAQSNRALKMLSRSNEAMIRAEDEASLLNEVCRIAVESHGYRMAWVGYAEDDEARSIRPVASAGDDDGLLCRTALTWKETDPAGGGPAGRSIRTGQPVVCEDVREDPTFHHLEDAVMRGYQSVLCLPLRDGPRTFGLLCLDSVEVRKVSAGETKLLQELADNLAFGVGAIRSRVERRRAEDDLVSSLKEKEALLKEVHHRVKNNLQVIASLLRLEGRRIDHSVTKAVLAQMQGRIQSMALLHETLYRSGDFSRIDLAAYLTQLSSQLFRAVCAQPDVVRLKLDLAPVLIEIDQAIPCGLIVNELASNSLKHGFPEGRSGHVSIGLRLAGKGASITLSVSDNGVGLPKDFDLQKTHSLGLQLVSDLARQLQGSLSIGPGPGAAFEVTFARNRTSTGEIPRTQGVGPALSMAPEGE